ncbi:MAG: tryptophan--tRNA ligase [Deltaproteobacteria bacterium]
MAIERPKVVPKKEIGERVVSGMRPTGDLHLGHYFGAIKNWLELQERYDCFFFVADWHALTSEFKDPSKIRSYGVSNVIDWLSVGIDPKRSVIFVQSHIKEHAELTLLLSMITPLGWLERNPTYKEQLQQLSGQKEISNLGFLGYPVLQAADVLIYQGNWVPVGEDQVPHLELCREIARRFNHLYGKIFVEPQAVLTEFSKLPGTDGRKMSNSYGNAIFLSDPEEVISKKIMTMMTDPARQRRQDPGNPDLCPLFDLHEVFTEETAKVELDEGCRTAKIGCVDCKKALLERLLPWYKETALRRKEVVSKPNDVKKILEAGGERARVEAEKTMTKVREVLNL